ncbi:uncharacterized protein LOC125570241 [Nematostella vectensis]|uniref:uncharacterized protein LOC125570241 n=1 Tax=Nematostella vectensis TaxID=45351 RepID=UPI002077155E|nr:uncharacterized protein LOC125570241 [Nematostella vectensis]
MTFSVSFAGKTVKLLCTGSEVLMCVKDVCSQSGRGNTVFVSFDPECWRHFPGVDNLADLLTRGMSSSSLTESELWWKGPKLLSASPASWPSQTRNEDEIIATRVNRKEKPIKSCFAAVSPEPEPVIDSTRYEKWYPEVKREVYAEEYTTLLSQLPLPKNSRILKLGPFFYKNDRVIRVGGRLQNSELQEETKHPVIISHGHFLTEKILRWVLCRKKECRFPHRLGIDFAGPLFVRGSSAQRAEKAYVCIVTFAASRMEHLGLTNDMSTDEFLQVLSRMVNRRGVCDTVWSDNAKSFQAADRELEIMFGKGIIDTGKVTAHFAGRGVKWKFITERTPWRAGFWERIVRSVKKSLRKVLGRALLKFSDQLPSN